MARSFASEIQRVFERLQSRQIAQMENLLAARSPQHLTSLKGFLGAEALVQRCLHSDALSTGRMVQRAQIRPSAAHEPSSISAPSQQRRTVTTSPESKQQLMYGSSMAEGVAPMITAKALDMLRSRDHLHHLGDAGAVHQELMHTLRLAQQLYRQQRIPNEQSSRSDELLSEATNTCKDQLSAREVQAKEVQAAPSEYEGTPAQLSQTAVEAGVTLHLTDEERRQKLFDAALADIDLDETEQRSDRWALKQPFCIRYGIWAALQHWLGIQHQGQRKSHIEQ